MLRMRSMDDDETNTASSLSQEPLTKKEPERKRRCSAGADILASYMDGNELDKISTPELKMVRPKRLAAIRSRAAEMEKKKVIPKARQRLSIDVGDRPDLRSCLKSTKEQSVACYVAGKISRKYKNRSRSIDDTTTETQDLESNIVESETGETEKEGKLRFDTVCTIKVITPRPQYDPDNVCLPSDDENSKNPSRLRLSTVSLNITPKSQDYLESIKGNEEEEEVTFRARMVFGDECSPGPTTAIEEPHSCSQEMIPIPNFDSKEISTESSSGRDSKSSSNVRRKVKRKSLISGAGLPLISPNKKLLQSNDHTRSDLGSDHLIEVDEKTNSIRRRSTRLIQKPVETIDIDSENEKISDTTIPQVKNKQGRRRSGFFKSTDDFQIKSPEKKRIDRRRSAALVDRDSTSEEDSVAKSKVVKEKSLRKRSGVLKIENENDDVKEDTKKKSRRSGVLDIKKTIARTNDGKISERINNFFTPISKTKKPLENDDDEAVVVTEIVEKTVIKSNMCEDRTVIEEKKKSGRKSFFVPTTQKRKDEVETEKSETSDQKKEKEMMNERRESEFIPTHSEVQVKPVSDVVPLPPKKMFSLFSPRVALCSTSEQNAEKVPLPVVEKRLDALKNEKTVEIIEEDEANTSKNSIFSTVSTNSGGHKREKQWGDRIASTYSYFTNCKVEEPILETNKDQKNWFGTEGKRLFPSMSETSDSFSFKMRVDNTNHENDNFILSGLDKLDYETKSGFFKDDFDLKQEAEVLKEVGVSQYKPTRLEQLVEGREEDDRAKIWVKKWKKRVRKEAKRHEKASEKEKTRKAGKGKSKGSSSDDDSDDDYHDSEEEGLENPLILIGPTGVGKTAFINALAMENNMKIIGMGPDEERKGTAIKSKLTEAMRSHRLTNSDSTGSLVRFFQNKAVEYSKNTSSAIHANGRSKSVLDKEFAQSLVVFEHVDVLLGAHDKNSGTALIELVNTAMVPVVWTCEKDYPRKSATVELEKNPLVLHFRRRKSRVQKCCQHLIYLATNVWIDDSTIKKLASSVDNDLRALIQQAYFFALAPKLSLPLTCRRHASDGFSLNWNIEKKESEVLEDELTNRWWQKYENRLDQYKDIVREVPDGSVRINFPYIDRSKTSEDSKLQNKIMKQNQHYEAVFSSFYGRFSRDSLKMDVVPILDHVDELERERKKLKRRHPHRFSLTCSSDFPIDADNLIQSMARIRSTTFSK